MDIWVSHYLWHRLARLVLFFFVTVAVSVIIYTIFAPLDIAQAFATIWDAANGSFGNVSKVEFAKSLAWLIGGSALGLAVSFGLFHALMLPLAIGQARKRVERAANLSEFAEQYDSICQELEKHPILGHAWYEFDKAIIQPERPGEPIRNTVRPQAFINIGVARERLFGLKMMPSIPGYFVGLGLLLTFIGLVIALSNAVHGMDVARQSAGGGAPAMQDALGTLLQAASFKFATSIAGLGSSLALSLIFRIYAIVIEGSFNAFCEAVEKRLRYRAPQSIAEEMNKTLAEQRDQLKEINSADFFTRMGQAMSSPMQSALHGAFEPLATQIDGAISQLKNTSQTGVEELLRKFSDSVQGGAGAELRELGISLKSMQVGMADAQRGISGSGADFARHMTTAAENMNRMVVEAGQSLGQSATANHAVLQDVVSALRETFERASARVDEELGRSASGAASRVEEAMGRVLQRLEEQVGGFQAGLASFQSGVANHLDETRSKATAAHEAAIDFVGRISTEAAGALKAGLADALDKISAEVGRFTHAMNSAELSLAAQAEAVGMAAGQSRLAADAFGKTAQDVRLAAAPLTVSSDRMAMASAHMSEAMAGSVVALQDSQKEARALTVTIKEQTGKLTEVWGAYKERFEKVDDDLGQAFSKLGEETRRQMESVSDFVLKVDEGFQKAISALAGPLSNISESTEELSETVNGLNAVMTSAAQEFHAVRRIQAAE